jgi:hypothetical protein
MSWNTYTAAGALKTAAASVGYGTSLPASPVDGQEYVLVDSTTNPTYQWRFRYNVSNSTSYKWEFIGGIQVEAEVATSESTAGAFADLATVGPSVTVPRAGVYRISFGSHIALGGTATFGIAAVKLGAAATSDTNRVYSGDTVANTEQDLSRTLVATLAASDVLKLQYRSTGSGASFANRWISVEPARVS